MLSTRPPPTLGASLENKKRIRSGSISLSLQHVSELLEEGVLENREQKGVVKDLIISGNEEILEMIHQYNQNGDKKPIQRLVRSYSFNRKSSLDLLGDDLTLEFAELLFPKPQQQQQQQQQPQAQENEEDVLGSEEHDAADLAVSQQQRRQDFRDDDEFEAYDVMLLGNVCAFIFRRKTTNLSPTGRPRRSALDSKDTAISPRSVCGEANLFSATTTAATENA